MLENAEKGYKRLKQINFSTRGCQMLFTKRAKFDLIVPQTPGRRAMTKAFDRELRKELLLKALEKFSDLEKAFDAVIRMERFILEGNSPADTRQFAFSESFTSDGVSQTADVRQVARLETHRVRRFSRRRRWREADDIRLRELCDEGYIVKEIANKLGRTPASVYGRMNQHGLSIAARPRERGLSAPNHKSTAGEEIMAESENATLSDRSSSEEQIKDSLSLNETDGSVGVEEVVHFLRTRDYSVVSTEDGRFKVDGRNIMDAQELLRRANRVRESMGKSSWAAIHASSPATDLSRARRNGTKNRR